MRRVHYTYNLGIEVFNMSVLDTPKAYMASLMLQALGDVVICQQPRQSVHCLMTDLHEHIKHAMHAY